MNRAAVIALVVAAVLGTTGGVVASLQSGAAQGRTSADAPAGSTGSTDASSGGSTPGASGSSGTATSSAPPPSPTPTDGPNQRPQPLLYAEGRTLHDGSRTVQITGPHNVAVLTRAATGYVVAEPASYQDLEYYLWRIAPDGTGTKIGFVLGLWDIDADGTRVVGFDGDAKKVTVWDVATGKVVARQGTAQATGNVAFAGNQVLISQLTRSGQHLLQWDPATGATKTSPTPGMEGLTVSPGGSYMAGAVGRSGKDTLANFCLRVRSTFLRKTPTDWFTCDYQVYATGGGAFSPDGTRVLAVPRETDGFGPGEFVVLDASDGPPRLVADVGAPSWTLGGEWAGNDALFLYGSADDDPRMAHGGWIDRCDLATHCTRVVTTKQRVVVGTVM